MRVKYLNINDAKPYLKEIGVDDGGVSKLKDKSELHFLYIKDLHVAGANILKQDALSIGADLAVPRGCVTCSMEKVECLLIATTKHLKLLYKKELSQPFGLKEVAKEIQKVLHVEKQKKIKIMGIINANDDSFYDGSRFVGSDAIKKIEQMIEDGADIIDIGGVSSRPNASIVSKDEELERVEPILEAIYKNKLFEKVKFSIDSYTPKVVQKALDSGFVIVNDITGLKDEQICKLCATYGASAVLMHMQGTPQTMQKNPSYDDVLCEVYDFFQSRIERAKSFGVKEIVLDVGIGFGKTLEHNLMLIKHLQHFLPLDCELLVGASRKSMIDKIYPSSVKDRLPGTLLLHVEAIKNGASYIRVHDVKEHIQALRVYEALRDVL